MKYKKEELEKMIDGLLKYCNIEEKLSNRQKIRILEDIKMDLEVDFEYAYSLASNTNDKKIIDKNLARMESNELAINEIELCTRYLKYKLYKEKQRKKEKYLHFIKKYVKI